MIWCIYLRVVCVLDWSLGVGTFLSCCWFLGLSLPPSSAGCSRSTCPIFLTIAARTTMATRPKQHRERHHTSPRWPTTWHRVILHTALDTGCTSGLHFTAATAIHTCLSWIDPLSFSVRKTQHHHLYLSNSTLSK